MLQREFADTWTMLCLETSYCCVSAEVPAEIDTDLLPGQVLSGRVTYVNAEDKRIHVALETAIADQLSEQLAQSTAEPGVSIPSLFALRAVMRGRETARQLVKQRCSIF